MQTLDILREIQKLPLIKRFYVIEETLKIIKKEELSHQMDLAANELFEEYTKNKELTSFTDIDFESFYEAK